MTAFFTRLEQWHHDGARRNVAQDIIEVFELIRPAWAVPQPTPGR